ncbi:MAG: MBL fold metallo-hydrolase [Thermodesulfobacteriota bacterium]
MKIKVLGASGSEVPGHNCPAFLVDGKFLLDAGTVALALNIKEERNLRYILLTHAHLDHLKGIPFLLDNLVSRGSGNTITVLGGSQVLGDLKKNIFNGRIWPDFTKIPSSSRPSLRYRTLARARPLRLDGYRITMEKVDHAVPANGYIVEDPEGTAIAYTGDTGPTDRFWRRMAGHDVKALITETSFPNRMEDLALASGHLTPALLGKEIGKMARRPERIYIMHLKPQFRQEIEDEIAALGRRNIGFLQDGEVIRV